MTLKEHIDDIRNNLGKGFFTNEAAVSQGIVLRLLNVLTWPTYNTQVIIPEYSVEGGRVDYALCHPPSKPVVFIEVKQVGNIEGAERQLFEYAFHKGVPIAILTDGREWRFFHPIAQGDYRERRVRELNLSENNSEESAECLNRYLNYESIRTGEAIKAIKVDYEKVVQQRQVATRLPEAWSKLVEEADEFLLDVVAEKVESLCGYRPTDEQVLDFLKDLGRKTKSEPTEVRTHQKHGFSPNPQQGMTKSSQARLRVIMSDGNIACRKAADTFCEVIEKIGIEKVKSLELTLCGIPLIAIDWKGSYQQKHRSKCDNYFITTHGSIATLAAKLKEIDEGLGVNMKVEIVDKQ
ncbi:MAG: type I restriction endonuclease [Candidatus Poribacteria bacterium]|nr:type I restriction endonuclease [Candidatus Poribacteria bacterium]